MIASNYAAIILSGGLSSRMPQLKPLLPLGSGTVVDQVISIFAANNVDVILVVGHRHTEIEKSLKSQNITIVYNPLFEQGMFTSVCAGVQRLQPGHRSFFILPVDIPLVRTATIRQILKVAVEYPDRIIYPVIGGKRGHPPLIPSALTKKILGWKENGGLKAFLSTQESLALEIPVADSNILLDMDTRADYSLVLERFQRYEIPADEESDVILNEIYNVPPIRNRHCLAVAKAAKTIGEALQKSGKNINPELIYAAARLHDIAKGQRKHDIAGGRILRDLGFGQTGDIVAVHSDLAGGDLHLSLEAKVVYLADKLVEEDRRVTLAERYDPTKRPFTLTPEIAPP